MKPVTKMLQRVKNEGLSVKEDHIHSFSYVSNRNIITYPEFMDKNYEGNAHSLAHELGHHHQYLTYPDWLRHLAIFFRDKRYYLLFFPFVLWEEIDAWMRARKICKDEGIATGPTFLKEALKGIGSYFWAIPSNIIKVGKYLLGIYVGLVFLVRFLHISVEMKLQLHPVVQSFRDELLQINLTDSELVSAYFKAILMILVSMEFFRLFFKMSFSMGFHSTLNKKGKEHSC